MFRFPLISVPPPVASRYAPGSPSWTAVWAVKTASEYTRRRPDADSSHDGSYHEAHRQSGLSLGSYLPAAKASNGGCPPFLRRCFGWPRPALVPRPADCGETALVGVLEASRHQMSDQE